jgi:hypothetical protein
MYQQQDKMKNSEEFINASNELEIEANLLPIDYAHEIISRCTQKYSIGKLSGHLAIHGDTIQLPLEPIEFSYSKQLMKGKAFLFFDQENHNRNEVVQIENAQEICNVLENCFGMEYFVTNEDYSYLISVNWYTVEVSGLAESWFKE